MQFNLSNIYPIDCPAFLLTQVCLVCPWVFHNGQSTILVFNTVGATIDCDWILFLRFLPLKVSTVGGINGSIQRSLITVTCKGSAVWISEQQRFGLLRIEVMEFEDLSTRNKLIRYVASSLDWKICGRPLSWHNADNSENIF